MKKLALALAVATALTGSAFASPALKTGFSVGGVIGASATSANISAPLVGDATTDPTKKLTTNAGRFALLGGVVFGYDVIHNCNLFGFQAGYLFTGGKTTISAKPADDVNLTKSYKRKNTVTIGVLVGRTISPSAAIYMRPGLNFNKYDIKSSLLEDDGTTAVAGFTPLDKKHTKASFTFGAGVKFALASNLEGNLQSVYDFGKSSSDVAKIKALDTTVGIAYKF